MSTNGEESLFALLERKPTAFTGKYHETCTPLSGAVAGCYKLTTRSLKDSGLIN